MFSFTGNAPASLLARLADWWRNLRQEHADLDRLGCGGAPSARAGGNGIEEIARDVGLSASELCDLARKGRGASDLLRGRLSALHINPKRLSRAQPAVMRDLEKVCSLCGSKHRCAHDLANGPADPRWRKYCPNAQTIDALEDAREDHNLASMTMDW
jgi:hypothetical protein